MIPSLFQARFKFKRFLPRMVFAFLLGAASVAAYLPPSLEGIRYVQSEMPELFTLLGFYISTSLPTFVLNLLYGFILPLSVSLLAVSTTRTIVLEPLYDGRMAGYLTSRFSRQSVMLTHWLAVLLALLLFNLALFLGQVLLSFILFSGNGVLHLLRVNLGFMALTILCGSFAVFMVSVSRAPKPAVNRSWAVFNLMLLLMVVSRLRGWVNSLRFVTFWSLFEGVPLLFGMGGWLGALIALALSALLLLASLFAFSNREL